MKGFGALLVFLSVTLGLAFGLAESVDKGYIAKANINLDADLMTIHPDPGQPITILEDHTDAGITPSSNTTEASN